MSPPPSPSLPRTSLVLMVVAVCLVAANMRATITGVGPLLDQIADDLGTTTVALGALASIPLVSWAVVSPFAHGLSVRFGVHRVVLAALFVLAAGTVWRSVPGPAVGLWLGTVLIGVALAIANVLMPAVVKRDFGRRVPLMMSAYTGLLSGVGALASGVVVPISHLGGGWRVALLCTGILLPLAVVAWMLIPGDHASADARGGSSSSNARMWRDPVAWLVAGYMGSQAASFYVLVTWIAPLAISSGSDGVTAGFVAMVFQLCGVAGSFALAAVLTPRLRRWVPAALPLVGILAVTGMLVAPALLVLWATIAGVSSGASLSMSLTLIAQRARDAETSSSLSGMSQSAGYLFAALGPVVFGALHALGGNWTLSLVFTVALLVLQAVVGLAVGRERFVFDRPAPTR